MEHRPFELLAVDLSIPHLHFVGEDALEGQTQHSTFFCAEIIGGIQVMDKHQVSDLLDHIQGVHQTTSRKNIPQAINSIFQFACNHINQSPYSKCKRYSGRRRS